MYGDSLILLCEHTRPRTSWPWTRRPARTNGKPTAERGANPTLGPLRRADEHRARARREFEQRVEPTTTQRAFLWHVGGTNQFPIPVPTFSKGVIYMTRATAAARTWPSGRAVAAMFRPSHVVWQVATGARMCHRSCSMAACCTWRASRRDPVIEAENRQEAVAGTREGLFSACRWRETARCTSSARRAKSSCARRAQAASHRTQRYGRAPDGIAGDLERTDSFCAATARCLPSARLRADTPLT